MKKILVSGSTAYDHIMSYDQKIRDQFFDGDIEQGLNMSLTAQSLEKVPGGTGLNICYNLALLGEDPVLLTSVGYDFVFDGIIVEKVILDYVHRDHALRSASSYALTDIEGNTLSFFHMGAMKKAHESLVSHVREELLSAIVSANDTRAMKEHIQALVEKWGDIFFDPAQQITEFTKEELQDLLEKTKYLFVNQYEYEELKKKMWMDDEDLLQKIEKIIVTFGDQGCELMEKSSIIHIPAIHTESFVDGTWAGDALRAGLLWSLKRWFDWKTGLQIGTIMARYCVENQGAQNHFFNLGVLMADMEEYFGVKVDLYERKGIKE